MKFGIIRPRQQDFRVFDGRSMDDALRLAGLTPRKTDDSRIYPGLHIVCDEAALFTRPQFYFALERRLFGGPCVLYSADQNGATIDFDATPRALFVMWLGDEARAENAIAAGHVERPRMAIAGDVFWQWPQPKPDMAEWSRRVAAMVIGGQGVLIDGDTLITPTPPTPGKG